MVRAKESPKRNVKRMSRSDLEDRLEKLEDRLDDERDDDLRGKIERRIGALSEELDRRDRKRRRSRTVLVAAVVLVAVCAGVAGVAFSGLGVTAEPSRALAEAKAKAADISGHFQSPVDPSTFMGNGVVGEESISSATLIYESSTYIVRVRYKKRNAGNDFVLPGSRFTDYMVAIKGRFDEADLDALATSASVGLSGADKHYDDNMNKSGAYYQGDGLVVRLSRADDGSGYHNSGLLWVWYK